MEVLLKCGKNPFLFGSAKLGFRLARNGLSSATTHHTTKNDVIGGLPNSADFCSKCGSGKKLKCYQVSCFLLCIKNSNVLSPCVRDDCCSEPSVINTSYKLVTCTEEGCMLQKPKNRGH